MADRTLDSGTPRTTRWIRPSRGWSSLDLRELWDYRELFYFLTLRDIKVRYKQTVFGVGWAVLQPLLTMVIFSIFFGRLAKMPSDGAPYPLFSLAALVPWTFFSNALSQSSASLVGSANMVRKVFFPRLIVPTSTTLAGLVDVAINVVLLVVVMAFFGYPPRLEMLAAVPLLMLAHAAALGFGFWLSALNVRYRDVRHTVPFLVQAWLFATPIAYPSSLLEEPWRTLYAVNPMVVVVEGFRWAFLGTEVELGAMAVISAASALLVLVSGLYFFRRMERTFADVI